MLIHFQNNGFVYAQYNIKLYKNKIIQKAKTLDDLHDHYKNLRFS